MNAPFSFLLTLVLSNYLAAAHLDNDVHIVMYNYMSVQQKNTNKNLKASAADSFTEVPYATHFQNLLAQDNARRSKSVFYNGMKGASQSAATVEYESKYSPFLVVKGLDWRQRMALSKDPNIGKIEKVCTHTSFSFVSFRVSIYVSS